MTLDNYQKEQVMLAYRTMMEVKQSNGEKNLVDTLAERGLEDCGCYWGIADIEVSIGGGIYICINPSNYMIDVVELGNVYFDITYTEEDVIGILANC